MTARHRKLPRTLTFLAVPTAMTAVLAAPAIALAQDASDPEVRALITPTNFVQIGGD